MLFVNVVFPVQFETRAVLCSPYINVSFVFVGNDNTTQVPEIDKGKSWELNQMLIFGIWLQIFLSPLGYFYIEEMLSGINNVTSCFPSGVHSSIY